MNKNSERAFSVPLATAICCAISLAFWGYCSLLPSFTIGNVGNDTLFLADGARRLAWGQVPHLDFSIPTGILPYVTYLLAEQAFPQFSAYLGSHLLGFVLLLPILIPAMAQMPRRSMALALAIVVGIAALLPFNIGGSDEGGYGVALYASYNRLGAAFSLAYLAWLFRAGTRPAWQDGLLVAYALLVAMSLKIVLIVVVIAPLLVLAVLNKNWRSRALIGAGVTAVTLLALQVSTGWVGYYVADIRAMSAVNASRAVYFFFSFIFKTLAMQVLAGALLLWVLFDKLQGLGGLPLQERAKSLAQPLAMIAAVGALIFSESQATGGLEFTAALGLLFAPGLVSSSARWQKTSLITLLIALIAGPLLIGAFEKSTAILLRREGPAVEASWVSRFLPHTVVPEVMLRRASATANLWQAGGASGAQLEAAAPDIVDRSAPDLYLTQWATVDLAIAALDANARSQLGVVITLSNVDFFGLALEAEPAKGTKIVHDVGRTIRPLSTEEARVYLSSADTVFAPTCAINEAPGNEPMSLWFTHILKAEFVSEFLTPCWTVYRRQTGLLPT